MTAHASNTFGSATPHPTQWASLILAGGGGTRLWPVSREQRPKQFHQLSAQHDSLLIETVKRAIQPNPSFATIHPPHPVFTITGNALAGEIKMELIRHGFEHFVPYVITEPDRCNTAPAIALSLNVMHQQHGLPLNTIVSILPSDHIIADTPAFSHALSLAGKAAEKGGIITFGIKPSRPETGYGYIESTPRAFNQVDGVFTVQRFIEKPPLADAERMVAATGQFLWNSGIFVATLGTLIEAYQRHTPELALLTALPYAEACQLYPTLEGISFDYAIMEHESSVGVVPLDAGWSDLGSWESVWELLPKDENGNAHQANQPVAITSHNTLVYSETNRTIATIGLENCLIIDTADALLISNRGDSQAVREVVSQVKQFAPNVIQHSETQHRTWGQQVSLSRATDVSLQQLTLSSNQQLSLEAKDDCRLVILSGHGEWTLSQTETTRIQPQALQALDTILFEPYQQGQLLAGPDGLICLLVGPAVCQQASTPPRTVEIPTPSFA